jgi:hypothetical protein
VGTGIVQPFVRNPVGTLLAMAGFLVAGMIAC